MPLMVAEEAVIPLKPVSQPGDVRAPIASGPGERQWQEFSIEVTSAERLKEMLAGAERTELLSAGLSPAVDRDLVPGVPHVLLRWRDRPVAVTTLLTSNTKAEAAVGPIHLVPSAPEGTLTLMVARLIDYARGQGFATFSLGMAPLNGVAADPLVPLGRRFGPVIFEHGEHFDALAELRAFKTGFEPVWQPRYLVADSRADPLAVMNDAAAAIAGPLRGGTSGGERRVPH
jgi:phosphatidylglycerol lysyltransferase